MALIKLPKLAGAMRATVRQWKIQPGKPIHIGQLLVELDTVDSLIHLNSPVSGTLSKILAQPATTVESGQSLAEFTPESSVVSTSGSNTSAAGSSSASFVQGSKPMTVTSNSGNSSAATPILMPQAGNTMEEGRILSWKVQEGQEVTAGQILCEIETDKATMEFESPVAGKIGKIVVPEGEVAAVKTPIAFLADGVIDMGATAGTETVSAPASGGSQAAVSAASSVVSGGASGVAGGTSGGASGTSGGAGGISGGVGGVKASPAARKLANEKGIDLGTVAVAGSGPGGRILSTDLQNVAAGGGAARGGVSVGTSGGGSGWTKKALTKMRKAIATNLQQSKQTVPHFYVRMTFDAGPMLAFYKAQKPATNCSINDVLLKGLGVAMMEFPAVRSRWDNDGIWELPGVNIGVAVGIDDGLVVPVVMGVERLGLAQLAVETKRVVENARKGKLENMGQASFTVSNLGMFGVEEFSAIINPPEAGILAVSGVRETVIVKDGAMRAGKVMTVTLSADHRIVDGLLAAQFLARLKVILENPQEAIA